jgi:hypothetical protein
MDRGAKKTCLNLEDFDLTTLLHPAEAFAEPMDVVNDLDLTLSEKRAILAAWASDACAVEGAPAPRRVGAERTAPFDDIVDALRELDRRAAGFGKGIPRYRRVLDMQRLQGVPGKPPRSRDKSDDRGLGAVRERAGRPAPGMGSAREIRARASLTSRRCRSRRRVRRISDALECKEPRIP